MKFNAENFKARINMLIKELPAVVSKQLEVSGEQMHDNIASRSPTHSPSWMNARSSDGQPYFTKDNSFPGLIDAIVQTKAQQIMVEVLEKGIVNLGFGHIPSLDTYAPYWENFERTRTGESTSVRLHGSDEYGFSARPGAGKRGEGSMKLLSEHPELKPHPGVLGVNLFGDEYLFYKSEIVSKVKESILELIKK